MPLVIVCGHPCSGKSYRSSLLVDYLTNVEKIPRSQIFVINHSSLKISRKDMYKDSTSEKRGQGSMKSAVERHLSQSNIVIADMNNYIKGIRYELFCRAREYSTTHCVLYCNSSIEFCTEMNKKREGATSSAAAASSSSNGITTDDERYDDGLLKDLIQRMEVPNETKKWDYPLFTVDEKQELPLKDIADALLRGKELKPSEAVVPQKLESSTYVFELDRISQAIVQEILCAQQSDIYNVGTDIPVSQSKNKIILNKKVSLAELRRVTRTFVKLMTTRTALTATQIADAFVTHINAVCNS